MNSAIDLADPSLPGQWCHAASGGSGSLTFRSLILQQPSELNCKKGCWQIPVSIISVSLKKIGANGGGPASALEVRLRGQRSEAF